MGDGIEAAMSGRARPARDSHRHIAGEASGVMRNMQESQTAVQHRWPVKVFIINNKTWDGAAMAGLAAWRPLPPIFTKADLAFERFLPEYELAEGLSRRKASAARSRPLSDGAIRE